MAGSLRNLYAADSCHSSVPHGPDVNSGLERREFWSARRGSPRGLLWWPPRRLVKNFGRTRALDGLDLRAEAVRAHRDIAYVPGNVSLWPNLSGGEVIDLLTGLRGG